MDAKRCNIERGYISTKRADGHKYPCKQQLAEHEAKSKEVDVDWVSQLPENIICHILSRIPTHTLFSCKCVSNTFLNIISTSYFDRIRNSVSPHSNSCLIIHELSPLSSLSILYTDDLEKSCGRDYCPMLLTKEPSVSQSQNLWGSFLVGSVNGVLCIRYLDTHIFYLCNPILGEYTLLPRPRFYRCSEHAAFGFCPKTKKYKVIRFFGLFEGGQEYTEIHTVGTNFWTTIETVPFPRIFFGISPCTLNGIIHWITDSSIVSNWICSIDLETDQLGYLPPPPQIDGDTLKRVGGIVVGALRGLFCVFYERRDLQLLEICVMKQYGVKESWYKEISINLNSTFGFDPSIVSLVPARVLNNGHLLLTYSGSSLVYYDPQKGTHMDIAPWGPFHCVAHVSSFISLKDIVGVENVEVVQREKTCVDWSSPDWGLNIPHLNTMALAAGRTLYRR